MASGFLIQDGRDLDDIFDPYSESTYEGAASAQNTGSIFLPDGTDIGQRYAYIGYGEMASQDTGFIITTPEIPSQTICESEPDGQGGQYCWTIDGTPAQTADIRYFFAAKGTCAYFRQYPYWVTDSASDSVTRSYTTTSSSLNCSYNHIFDLSNWARVRDSGVTISSYEIVNVSGDTANVYINGTSLVVGHSASVPAPGTTIMTTQVIVRCKSSNGNYSDDPQNPHKYKTMTIVATTSFDVSKSYGGGGGAYLN